MPPTPGVFIAACKLVFIHQCVVDFDQAQVCTLVMGALPAFILSLKTKLFLFLIIIFLHASMKSAVLVVHSSAIAWRPASSLCSTIRQWHLRQLKVGA